MEFQFICVCTSKFRTYVLRSSGLAHAVSADVVAKASGDAGPSAFGAARVLSASPVGLSRSAVFFGLTMTGDEMGKFSESADESWPRYLGKARVLYSNIPYTVVCERSRIAMAGVQF